MTIQKTNNARSFNGVVLKDKMDKTIVVVVEHKKWHPKYQKQYTVSKKFKVHDEKNQYTVGEKVTFYECRPLSKDKRWFVFAKDEVVDKK